MEAQKEFEQWLSHQTAPRQAPPKKQMQNEESLAPVDDKERSAVAVRTNVQNGGPRGISRPSSDGFRPRAGQRPGGPQGAPQPRAWNSQRGPQRPITASDVASPPRSRATTMADSLNPANYVDEAAAPNGAVAGPAGRSPTRKSPTPRPGANGRPKTPTPRPGSTGPAQRRRPPSARKENGVRNGRVGSAGGSGPGATAAPGAGPAAGARGMGGGMSSSRPVAPQVASKRKTPRTTPRRERPPSVGGMGGMAAAPVAIS